MKNINIKQEAIIWLILLIPIVCIAYYYNQLPQQVPTHFDLNGQPDSYGSKWIMPIVNIIAYFLLLIVPFFDPKRSNYQLFANSYFKIRLLLALFLSGIATLITLNSNNYNNSKIILLAMFLLFAGLGNYMQNIRPNWFAGIRTPWTLSNENVWRKTHLLGGKLWFIGGIIGFILAIFVNVKTIPILVLLIIVPISIVPVVYSYLLYKQETKDLDDTNN